MYTARRLLRTTLPLAMPTMLPQALIGRSQPQHDRDERGGDEESADAEPLPSVTCFLQ
jgi:hypothetical protein